MFLLPDIVLFAVIEPKKIWGKVPKINREQDWILSPTMPGILTNPTNVRNALRNPNKP